MNRRGRRFAQGLLLAVSVAGLVPGAWSLGWWLRERWRADPLPMDFQVGPSRPLAVLPGRAMQIPWWHRDFELTGRVRVPRGAHLDLVVRLQPGPPTSSEDDRTPPLGPREWSGLRLSAGDLGPPFFDARSLPDTPGGARVAPDQPTDVRLIVRGHRIRAEVGHDPLPETGWAWAEQGVLAFAGSGTIEALVARALPPRPEPPSALGGLGLALGAAFLGGLVWWRLRRFVLGLFVGSLLAVAGGWILAQVPRQPGDSSWTPRAAPSFERAVRLYGEPDGFRNWGAYASQVFWRGQTEFQHQMAGIRRVLVLGGRQVWGITVPIKASSLAMQVEGLLDRRRREGQDRVTLVVAATRETDLVRQLRILEEDLAGFGAEAVLLFCPPEVLSYPEQALFRIGELADRLGSERLVVVAPLVPQATERTDRFVEELSMLARAKRFQAFDPGVVLAGLEGAFGSPEQGSLPDLAEVGHHALAAGIAPILEGFLNR